MKIMNSFSIMQSLKVTCLEASVVVFMGVFFDFNVSVETQLKLAVFFGLHLC